MTNALTPTPSPPPAPKPKTPPLFRSLGFFVFEAPLYTEYYLGDDNSRVLQVYGRVKGDGPNDEMMMDAYCPHCKADTPFVLHGARIPAGDPVTKIRERFDYDVVSAECTRAGHKIYAYFRLQRMVIQKVGQFPSLADIAIQETRQKYRKALDKRNDVELFKAIALAAHGEGIGAIVYLRRVFERLIRSRFDEFKQAEGWAEPQFRDARMEDKIGLLKDHLPPFLVQSRKIYSIFSEGVHELDNDACLQFFPVGKQSILIILQEDVTKLAELAERAAMQQAIAQFQSATAKKPEGD